MNDKDEILEDISTNQNVESLTIEPAIEETPVTPSIPVIDESKTEVMEPIAPNIDTQYETLDTNVNEPVPNVGSSKSKKAIIIILSILLVLDLAALVIYLIGVDKVLGFVK